MSTNKIKYIKLIASQILGFFASYYLVTHVFIGPMPVIRSDFQDDVVHLPQKTVEVVKKAPEAIKKAASVISSYQKSQSQRKQTDAHVPPPWIFGNGPSPLPTTQIFPTIQNQPTSIPEPTSIYRLPTRTQQNPTSIPTSIPQVTSIPTSIPQITSIPRNTSVPTQPPEPTSNRPPESGNASLEQQTIDEINKRRRDVGLRDLKLNNELTQAARRHSADMSQNNFCGHNGTDGSNPFQRAKDAGYRGSAYGETVACGARTPLQAVDMWWSSPPHHAILTNGGISEIGLGWVNVSQTAVVGM